MASLKALAGRSRPGFRSCRRSRPSGCTATVRLSPANARRWPCVCVVAHIMGHKGNTTVPLGAVSGPGPSPRCRPGPESLHDAPPRPHRTDPATAPCRTRPRVSYSTWDYSDSTGYQSGPRRPSAGISGRSDPDFPHFAPRPSTWQFIVSEAQIQLFWTLTVEECGVQWSAVVQDGGRR